MENDGISTFSVHFLKFLNGKLHLLLRSQKILMEF